MTHVKVHDVEKFVRYFEGLFVVLFSIYVLFLSRCVFSIYA
jgi:hypothetical protein